MVVVRLIRFVIKGRRTERKSEDKMMVFPPCSASINALMISTKVKTGVDGIASSIWAGVADVEVVLDCDWGLGTGVSCDLR